jgi:hypothetical protein
MPKTARVPKILEFPNYENKYFIILDNSVSKKSFTNLNAYVNLFREHTVF